MPHMYRGIPEKIRKCTREMPEIHGNGGAENQGRSEKRSGIRRNESNPDGVPNKPRHVVNAEAMHQVGPMCLNGLHAQAEPLGHVLRGMTLCN